MLKLSNVFSDTVAFRSIFWTLRRVWEQRKNIKNKLRQLHKLYSDTNKIASAGPCPLKKCDGKKAKTIRKITLYEPPIIWTLSL